MKILTIPKIRELDKYTINNEPISSFNLMERAAYHCFLWISKHISSNDKIAVVCGFGNNGGDGLAIARLLKESKYDVTCYTTNFSWKQSEDNRLQELRFLKHYKLIHLHEKKDFQKIEGTIIIDALFGSGLSKPLQGNLAALVDYLNSLHCKIISIDSPSGLYLDKKSPKGNSIIRATNCLSLQLPKKGMLIPENGKFIGDLHIIDIGLSKKAIDLSTCKDFYLEVNDVRNILKSRTKYSHKGDYGHALIVSGSKGKVGASILMAKACLRTGLGLLTVHIPECGYTILQSTVPEAMVQCDKEHSFISHIPVNEKQYLGVGPGLGQNTLTTSALTELLEASASPILLDADALNIIASHRNLISKIPANSILTPHRKEAERLFNTPMNDWELHEKAREFALQHNVYFVLKGAHSQIHCPNGTCYFNSTGNPGMATAGSGDVLSGIITSLLTQQYTPKNAAILGVYLHGLAGDIMATKLSEEALCASDIINGIPLAYKQLKAH